MPQKQKKTPVHPVGPRITAVIASCFLLGWFWAGMDVFSPQSLSANIFNDQGFANLFEEFKAENLPPEDVRLRMYEDRAVPSTPNIDVTIKMSRDKVVVPAENRVGSVNPDNAPAYFQQYLSSAPHGACIDSDGGVNFGQRGGVIWKNDQNYERTFWDQSLGTYELLEFYCEDSHVAAKSMTCKKTVRHGACIESLAEDNFFSSAPVLPTQQTFDFMTGWNWVSFSIDPFSRDPEVLFAAIVTEDPDFIIKDYRGNIYWPKMEINTLGDIELEKGYQIYVSRRMEISIPGVDMLYPLMLNFKTGWNFMSVPFAAPQDIKCLMKSFLSQGVLRAIEDQSGKRFSYINDQWVNNIGSLEPGRSYLVYIQTASDMTLPLVLDTPDACVVSE